MDITILLWSATQTSCYRKNAIAKALIGYLIPKWKKSPKESSHRFLIHIILLAFSLGVTCFTNPPIGKALAFDHGEQLVMAFGVGDLEARAAIVAELGKVAMQVSLAAMLVDADHATLEH